MLFSIDFGLESTLLELGDDLWARLLGESYLQNDIYDMWVHTKMTCDLKQYSYQPKTNSSGQPIKHKGANSKPEFFYGNDNHPEGMCPSTIKLDTAAEILRDGIPYSPQGWSKSHPKWVFNIYEGAVYKAVETVPGASYHGFPCPGPRTHPRKPDMPKLIKDKLFERARERDCLADIEAWFGKYP
ncbi:hypothetical protein UCD39_10965 [Nitrospirillum sp. BR 11752]|uniref:hypothetical protein n=1 Tax=Nitrospirillum sp. BR 11752 TaxID=3104293 RepID=UPI002EB7E0EE|nr:hypothetical protein [Nitrospirillum sp. BR 11752]